MNHVILGVSGVPASGKTSLSRLLGVGLEMDVISLNDVVLEEGLSIGYDAVRDTRVVDVQALDAAVRKRISADTIVDGLMSHLLTVTHVLVLRCSPLILISRMAERGYAKEKIMENIEVEYLGTILYEALKRCDNVLEVDNTGGADVEAIRSWILEGGKKTIEKDWTAEFEKILSNS